MRIHWPSGSFFLVAPSALLMLIAPLACKQSDGGSPAPTAATGPDVAVVSGVGVGGTLAGAEQDAKARAAKGEARLVAATLSGAKELCVAIAWKTPLHNRRAIFATITGPVGGLRSQRAEPGATGGLCVEKATPGTYTIALAHGPSMAEAPAERLPAFSVTLK